MMDFKPPKTADVILNHSEKILKLWSDQVRSALPAARKKDELALRDALPIFLKNLAGALSPMSAKTSDDETEISREHGAQRASIGGYSIDQVLEEYTVLRKSIFEVVEVEQAHAISATDRDIIIDCLFQGVREAGSEFAQRQMAELKRSNEELEGFAYLASHDLQEPLRMITSYMSLLDKRMVGRLNEEEKEYFSFIVDGAKRMKILIDALLAYAQVSRSTAPSDSVSLEDAANLAVSTLHITIQETGAQVKIGALPTISGNPAEFGQVFQNLLSNALKYRGKDPPRIEITSTSDNQSWTIAVSDNGIGINLKDRERVFKLFQRLHDRRSFPGSGIGLSICKKIIELYHGRIWMEPNEPAGAIFKFSIPKL